MITALFREDARPPVFACLSAKMSLDGADK